MDKDLNNDKHVLFSVIFGIAVFCFWCFIQRGVLNYQEQLQMFLFTSDYFVQRIIVPGGLSDYIAEFLTQFYYYPILGGLVLSSCFVILQRQIWTLTLYNGALCIWYPLSFIPILLLWSYMGDESVLLSFVIALIAVLLFLLFYTKALRYLENSNRSKTLYDILILLVGLPVFYWLFGSVVFVLVIYISFSEILHHHRFVIGLISMVYTICMILFFSCFLQYPLYRLFFGINYYRFPSVIPYMQWMLMVLFALFPIVVCFLPSVKKSILLESMTVVVLIICGSFLIKESFNPVKYRLFDDDYWVRIHQWNKIIREAEKHQPTTPMGVSCLNLALEMQGSLPDRMFRFFQNGTEGLVPAFQRDFTTPIPTSEIFLQMGMINSAERYAFEAQEAIPNYRKSSRCYQRLAECEIINGQYEVAKKFLLKLSQTLFYRKWAIGMMKCLSNEKKVEHNPQWVRLRKFRLTEDFLFSESQIDQIFGLLFAHSFKNRMSYEYLMAWQMLERNLQGFGKYYPLGRFVGYKEIPRSYQETLVYLWSQTHADFDNLPYSVSPVVCNEMVDFARSYIENPHDPNLVNGEMGKTYWSYLLCRR